MPVLFSVEDLKTAASLERVLRQFQDAVDVAGNKLPPPIDLNKLAMQLAPLINQQLQASGSAPLNLQSLLPAVGDTATDIEDSHANRLTLYTPPAAVGATFFETDRTVSYVAIVSSGAIVWRYKAGTYIDTLANRPADLGVNDTGFRFVVSTADVNAEYVWMGTEWVTVDYLQEVEDAATATVVRIQILRKRSSGNPAVGFGTGQLVQLEDASNQDEDASAIDTVWTNATSGAETTAWSVSLRNAGAALASYFRVRITDIAFKVGGFLGIFTHANTVDRTYTFADADGNIVYETAALTNNNFVLGAGGAAVKDAGFGVGQSNTITLAKITAGGTNGSITFTNGLETAHVDPT